MLIFSAINYHYKSEPLHLKFINYRKFMFFIAMKNFKNFIFIHYLHYY
jgi:hypothetical protein